MSSQNDHCYRTMCIISGRYSVPLCVNCYSNHSLSLSRFLIGEGMSMLTSYSDLKEYTKQHPHLLLTLTENTTTTEFIGLLVSLLSYHTPLAVVTNVGCLPLNQRPRYYSRLTSAPTFHLWSVSRGQWIKLPQDDTFDHQRVKDFLNRLQYPIIVVSIYVDTHTYTVGCCLSQKYL